MAVRSDKRGNSGAENPESRQISPLGRAIRYFREDQGLSQEHLAELAKIDKQRISDIERGATQTLHSPKLKAIANGLGISTDELRGKAQEFRVADTAGAASLQMRTGAVVPKIMHNNIRAVPGFTGREDLLAGIEAVLWRQGGTAALTNSDEHAAAVKGLGGVGKSMLAREYAWQARERYRGIWWVRAETEQTIIDDLIDLGSHLMPNLKEVLEQNRAVRLALDAIAGSGPGKPWLIVYDNVEKPGAIARLTPVTGAHVLVTSRWPRWQGHAHELPVDVFPEDVAVDFLIAERSHEAREAARRLAVALGCLPLALSHARTYCAEVNLSFDDYTKRLSELIHEAPEDAEYPASVFATFSLAIAKATEACLDAEKLMAIVAFLAPEGIPLDIITADVMSEKQREKAIAALFKVSLITHETLEGSARGFSVHRIVQEVMRSRASGKTADAIIPAFRLMRTVVDSIFLQGAMDDWNVVKRFLPHIASVLDLAPKTGEAAELMDAICIKLDLYFCVVDFYREAPNVPFARNSIEERLWMMTNFYIRRDRYEDAEKALNHELRIRRSSYGEDHPGFGNTLGSLAHVYHAQGQNEKAEALYKKALDIVEQARGEDDWITGRRLFALANFYLAQLRHSEAEPLYIRALSITQKSYGDEHPANGPIAEKLAEVYRAQNRNEEAKEIYNSVPHTSRERLVRFHGGPINEDIINRALKEDFDLW